MAQESTLAVVSQSGETLSFFDLSTGKRSDFIEDMLAEPHELCLDDKRGVLYCTHAYAHGHFWAHGDNGTKISIVDINKRQVAGEIDVSPYGGPHGIRLHGESDTLYVSVEFGFGEEDGPGGVIGIDLRTQKVVRAAPAGAKAHWMVITPDAGKAYTSNKTAPFCSVLDLRAGKLLKKIELPTGCEELDLSADGRFVYVPTPTASFGGAPRDPAVKVIDVDKDEIVQSIPLALGPGTIHVTSEGKILVGLYRMMKGSESTDMRPAPGRLAVFAPNTFEKLGEVDIGLYALTVRSTRDGKTAFTANILGGTVSVVDLESMKVTRTLEVDIVRRTDKQGHQGAHGLAVF